MEVPERRIGGRKRRPDRPSRRPKESVPPSLQWLPEDVLEEIFHRLPLKSMVLVKSTCKKWNSILSNPQFFHQTINHRLGGNHHLIFFNPNALKLSMYTIGNQNKNHLIHENETSITLSAFKKTFNPSYHWAMLLGTCNGLVALYIDPAFVLCNPLTGEYTSFHIEISSAALPYLKFQVGLCYDASGDEYIMVIVVKYILESIYVRKKIWDLHVSFKHGIGKWRFHGRIEQHETEFVEGIGKVFCGNAHWIYEGIRIIYFDAKAKRFNHMNFPGFDGDDRIMGFAVMDGEHQLGIVVGNTNSSCLDVWVMKEYGNSESWTHLFEIKIPKLNDNKVLCLDVLGFTSTGELMIDMGMEGFWVCDLQRQCHLRQIQTCSDIDFSKTYLATYKPSVMTVSFRRDRNHRERKSYQLDAEIEEATSKRRRG